MANPDTGGTERLVIQRRRHSWTVISRARLRQPGPNGPDTPTPVGAELQELLRAVDGLAVGAFGTGPGYGVHLSLVHETLWAWDVVEAGVLDAYRQALKVDALDVVREDKTRNGGDTG